MEAAHCELVLSVSSTEWPGVRMALLLKDIKVAELKLSHTGQELNPQNEEVEEKPENPRGISR